MGSRPRAFSSQPSKCVYFCLFTAAFNPHSMLPCILGQNIPESRQRGAAIESRHHYKVLDGLRRRPLSSSQVPPSGLYSMAGSKYSKVAAVPSDGWAPFNIGSFASLAYHLCRARSLKGEVPSELKKAVQLGFPAIVRMLDDFQALLFTSFLALFLCRVRRSSVAARYPLFLGGSQEHPSISRRFEHRLSSRMGLGPLSRFPRAGKSLRIRNCASLIIGSSDPSRSALFPASFDATPIYPRRSGRSSSQGPSSGDHQRVRDSAPTHTSFVVRAFIQGTCTAHHARVDRGF